jgi:HD superfamily phosphohydrolase YqeK
VAYQIAVALAENGARIDPHLVRAGGLLHDVAKGKADHALEGARYLRDLEFARVADVVATHTDYPSVGQELDEAAIVYLADKLVSGDKVVGVKQRFQRSLDRFENDPIALAAAMRRQATAESIAQEIEAQLGIELSQVIGVLSESCNRAG